MTETKQEKIDCAKKILQDAKERKPLITGLEVSYPYTVAHYDPGIMIKTLADLTRCIDILLQVINMESNDD